jgi:hypothetical protein
MIDLPSYTNRISQRSRHLSSQADIYAYILAAGKPEFQPLPLNSEIDANYQSPGVEQVFFTTLERQYLQHKTAELEQFHWLFLTKGKNSWWIVTMFSHIGKYPLQQPIAPVRNSSDSTIAQGIRAWFRDCEAGSIKFKS